MRLVKKTVMGLLLVFGGLVLLFGMTVYNLKNNSVYYARQMPHNEGTEPDLVMLLENIWWIYKPEDEDVTYDDDMGYPIANTKRDASFTKLEDKFLYEKGQKTYFFDKNFHIEAILNGYSYISLEDYDNVLVKKELRLMLKPVLDAQTKPLVNLQWLFNILYQDRFD